MQYQRTFKSPFFVYCKKHFCPACNAQLARIKVSKTLRADSPEAKKLNSSSDYTTGNITFAWTEFLCPQCNKQISIDEMKQLEKSLKTNK